MPEGRVRTTTAFRRLAALGTAGALAGLGFDAFRVLPSPFHLQLSALGRAADDQGGFREASWSPDSRFLVASRWDRLWILARDGSEAAPIAPAAVTPGPSSDREPAWSPDGRWIAFATDRGGGFDLYALAARSNPAGAPPTFGAAVRLTSLAGDERRPSWTPDNRIVFSYRGEDGDWDVHLSEPWDGSGELAAAPVPGLSSDEADELDATVSPDGRRIAFSSDRSNDDRDLDLWVTELPPDRSAVRQPVRLTRAGGDDRYPSWSPDGQRLAHFSVRDGLGSVWVTAIGGRLAGIAEMNLPRPRTGPTLVSRHGGVPAWSPDGGTIVIAESPQPDPMYNGNPQRFAAEPPPTFAGGQAYRLWTLPAPAPIDDATTPLHAPAAHGWEAAFDRVWHTLLAMYYAEGTSRELWTRLREHYRPLAANASSGEGFEDVVDDMVARQPPIKSGLSSHRGVVVAAHPLAARAGAQMLERGGNVVDAAIAVSFAVGVVEPDASGIGGDGMVLLFQQHMREPVAIDFKDQTAGAATLENPAILRDGRLVADGPAAANIPGVVAGLDLLYRRYASGRIPWADLIAPAVAYAEDGFVLDAALPSTIAAGRRYLEKYPEAARIFLPGGRLPKAGERFTNPDYARTLRTIAADPQSFYRGTIARRIADDLEANGGIITYEDLAQYRAIARKPVTGAYRGHEIFSAPPPVSAGASLIETLQILDFYRPGAGARYAADAEFLHYAIEAQKVRDRIRRVADPERWPVDLENHLTPEHARQLFHAIDPGRASLEQDPPDEREADDGSRIGRGTTAFVVADAQGNVIVGTQTLSTWGGAFYVSKGLGFLYNNHLRSTSARAPQFGHLLPRMRSTTTTAPTLVFRREGDRLTPRLAVAAAGNAWITASVYGIILNVIDGGMDAQAAVEAPRFLVARDPSDPAARRVRVQIEDRFPRRILADLEARGHRFQKIGRKGEVRFGYAAAALIDRAVVTGAAEPRRSHAVAAPGDDGLPERTGEQ
jgi:gamma-glutamyltranspeptidase